MGQLGDGTTETRSAPVQVQGLTDVVTVVTTWGWSMAMKSDGTIWAWGDFAPGLAPGSDPHVPQQITFGLLDSNNNGMDDRWENGNFGDLNQPPDGDFDGDGISNLQEFLGRTDPTDYYNGTIPVIAVAGGDNQQGDAGTFLPAPLTIHLTNPTGEPLVNAPVTFTVTQGGGDLAAAPGGELLERNMSLRTDASGVASVYYSLPLVADDTSLIMAQAGAPRASASATLTATTSSSPPPGPTPSPTPPPGGTPGAGWSLVASLNWDGVADWDFHLETPNAHVYYGNRTADGFTLDRDAYPACSQGPSAPEGITGNGKYGTYKLYSNLYSPCGGSPAITFTATVTANEPLVINGTFVDTGETFTPRDSEPFTVVPAVEIEEDNDPEHKLGGMVDSNLGPDGENHFVSPPNLPDNPNYTTDDDYVTFVATGVTDEQFNQLLEWDTSTGAPVSPTEPRKWRVYRVIADKYPIRVLTKSDNREVAKLNLWIVKADVGVDPHLDEAQMYNSHFRQTALTPVNKRLCILRT